MISNLLGTTLGAYQLVEKIGKGGMATVYKAYHPPTDRFVAAKVLLPEYTTTPMFAARFEHEARMVASLQHVHILPVFDYGNQDGVLYLIMPYIASGTLRDRMEKGRYQLTEVRRILWQLADAIDYAHRKNILHRDLKPENVLVDENQDVRLTDFGIARMMEDARLSTTAVMGTPVYMSPEQGKGETIDARSDLYALGVMLYEMVVGDVPFYAPNPEALIYKHVHEPVPSPRARNPHLSKPIEMILMRALEKDPAARFSNAKALAQGFETACLTESDTQEMPTRRVSIPSLTETDLPQPTNHADEQHIFVSYSSEDRKPFVEDLVEDLVSERYTVWIDNVGAANPGIIAGEAWKKSIANALNQAAAVLLVLTPTSVRSQWVQAEIRRAQQAGKPIIPILLQPIENPADRFMLSGLNLDLDQLHYRDFANTDYALAFQQLLRDLSGFVSRVDAGVITHCRKYPERFMKESIVYMEGEARLLPINASPYDQGIAKVKQENLLARLWRSKRMLVLGEPGQGKTMALEQLALRLVTTPQIIVPIYIKLLRYKGEPLLELVRQELISTDELKHRTLEETKQFLEETRYECYFLLDGLNEVRPEHRDRLNEEITHLAMEFPRHRMVVTSRVQDKAWRYLRQHSPIQDVMLIQPVREEQIQKYLLDSLGQQDGKTLWLQLDSKMRGLASNPLMLWLIKEAWLQAQATRSGHKSGIIRIPDNRGELYESFVMRMLARDDERRLNDRVSEADRLRALELIALEMHAEKSLTMSRREVLIHIQKALPMSDRKLVLDSLQANGLLIGDQELRFAPHQTIQEYFTARALKEEVSKIVKAQSSVFGVFAKRGILENADDVWWAETFIQIVGLVDDPNALAMTMAKFNPWLAWWCVQEGRAVDQRTANAIQARSMELVRSHKVEERRRAAETLAKLQTPRVLEPLISLLGDSVSEIYYLVSEAIRTFGESAIPFLVNALADESLTLVTRVRAVNLLVQVGGKDELKSPRVLKPLVQLSITPQPEIAIEALQTLLGMGEDGEMLFERALLKRSPILRSKWGEAVAENDTRPGVGLTPEGLPHVVWCAIDGAVVRSIELPDRTVEPFYMAKYPITYAQFQTFLDDPNGYSHESWWRQLPIYHRGVHPQPFPYANYPRVAVNWYEAVAFCRWLTVRYRETGMITDRRWVIRLPTEWEWEQAAAGYLLHDPEYDRIQGFDITRGNNARAGINSACAVGLFPEGKSPFGVLDMGGNIREWCYNFYNVHTRSRPEGDTRRALRGGSWREDPGLTQPQSRDFAKADEHLPNVGFRVCAAIATNKAAGSITDERDG